MATITPTLILSQKGKDNTYPIYFSISFGRGKRKFENSKIRIKREEWDKSKRQVIKHPNAIAYNLFIKNRIANFEKEKVLKDDKELSAIFNQKKHGNILFKDFALEVIEEKNNKSKDYEYMVLRQLCNVPKMKNILIVDINPEIIIGVQKYFWGKGLKINSVYTYMKSLGMYLKIAHKRKIISENPFGSESLNNILIDGRDSSERIFLNKNEVKLLIDKYEDFNKKYQLYLGCFLISCYTGLRASDVSIINLNNIYKEGSISLKTQKTGEQLRLPLTKDILKIISLMLKNPYHRKKIIYQRYLYNIKKICQKAGIKKKISTHVARHTFAMRLAEMGVSIEVAQQLLGHTDIKTTSIYYKIGNKRINDEMSKFGYS